MADLGRALFQHHPSLEDFDPRQGGSIGMEHVSLLFVRFIISSSLVQLWHIYMSANHNVSNGIILTSRDIFHSLANGPRHIPAPGLLSHHGLFQSFKEQPQMPSRRKNIPQRVSEVQELAQ
jgi:hypothetical protein